MRRVLWLICLAELVGMATVGCAPGQLDEDKQDYLRKELERRYPVTEGDDKGAQDSGVVEPSSTEPSSTEPSSTEPSSTEPSSTEPSSTEPSSSSTSTESTSTDTTSTEPPPADTVPACAVEVFTTTCAGSACHYGGTFQFAPNFTNSDLFATLTTGMTTCDTPSKTYVNLDAPESSYLLLKLHGEQPGNCGTQMPPDTTTLSADQLKCVEDWIGSL